jgi:long-chain acyl-CoA synthetase
MIDLDRVTSLGEALDTALRHWTDETCLIEADRDRENLRLTYGEFSIGGRRLDAFLRGRGFEASDRAAIVMTNQSKWHLSAFAVFRAGGVLVPLDFKLEGSEHLRLLAHCAAKVLLVEHHLWQAMSRADGFDDFSAELVLVTETPADRELPAAGGATVMRWEDAAGSDDATAVVPRSRDDVACIVYSSGTGGRPKGCLLTHGNYLEQFRSLSELHPLRPGFRYLSILPTNHAIDFMVGFIGPYLCGATVVHLRTLRPEFVRDAFPRYRITHMALVPMVLKNLATGLRSRFAELTGARRAILHTLITLNRKLSRGRPNPRIARKLLPAVHAAFGGRLEALFVGGAYTDPDTLRFFHDLGIPVANGYGLTEAGTALTLDRLAPPRPDTVGPPLPGVELRIDGANEEGVGEIVARGPTLMRGYLDDPELTAETIVDGWLHTGDLGRFDDGALRILGRRKNMIVTEGGKNVYPEDVEGAFADLPNVTEFCVFAAHTLWPERAGRDERLLLVIRTSPEGPSTDWSSYPDLREEIVGRNRRLLDFKRVKGLIVWDRDFPRTASMKIKREELAAAIARKFGDRVMVPAGGDETIEVERGVIDLS